MTTLKGKQLLDRLQRKIKDPQYSSYDELTEAQEWIARQTSYTWLRESNTNAVSLISGTREYGLNVANLRSITQMWIAPTSTTTAGSVAGITLSGTTAVSIKTNIAHGAVTDDKVTFANVGGTSELNGNTYTITKTDTTNFTLNGTNSSSFTAWTSGGDVSLFTTTDTNWQLMVETPEKLFEDKVKGYTSSTTTNNAIKVTASTSETDTTRTSLVWYYRLKVSTTAPFWKIIITPTPSQSYKIRVDYIRIQDAITETGFADVPFAYNFMLLNYAAGLILQRSENQLEVALGMRYMAEAEKDILKIVWDSQKNRTDNIDRRKRAWIR